MLYPYVVFHSSSGRTIGAGLRLWILVGSHSVFTMATIFYINSIPRPLKYIVLDLVLSGANR
jgi:hypothetical protein